MEEIGQSMKADEVPHPRDVVMNQLRTLEHTTKAALKEKSESTKEIKRLREVAVSLENKWYDGVRAKEDLEPDC